ncbi:MAG: Alpha/beta hydrolase family protein [Phycisphaerales bacterium]|nr:Alpha/beta hydrolase family protein [Phycisphaerales bacterium]
MPRPLAARILSVLTLLVLVPVASADPTPGKQTAEHYDPADGSPGLGYLLYLPADYGKDPAKRWPVMLFLHGSGEAGNGTTQLDKVKVHGPPKVVGRDKDFPFVLISPQNPAPVRPEGASRPAGSVATTPATRPAARRGGWNPQQLKGLLDTVLANQAKQADPDRVYLTGLSMGGFGSWAMAAMYPDTFAAVAPICGGGDPASADKIKHLPIWVFHGEKDPTVPIARSEAMVTALKATGAKDVQFTRYPDAGHDSWTVTYDNPRLYAWFLSHSRSVGGK